MTEPVIIDFYCCQGGKSAGLRRAGFRVIGVDKDPQPNYPFDFVQGNVLEIFWDVLRRYRPVAVSGSPPCQAKTKAQRLMGNDHPRLIRATRELFVASGLPYAIENVVPDQPELDEEPLINPVTLCGAMFGLHTHRHREIESNVPLNDLGPCPAPRQQTIKMGRPLREGDWYHAVGHFSGVDYVRRDMGVPWMNRDGIRECIPPAYGEWIGRHLLAAL